MTSDKRTGRIAGTLLLVQLVTGLFLPYVLLTPLTAPPAAFLDAAAGMATVVRINVLLLVVGGAVSVAISVAMWPVVREHSTRLGLWLLALAGVNFTLQLVENTHWMTMLSVSQAYATAGVENAEPFLSLGIAVRSSFKWAHYSHIGVVVGWLFTFYWLLARAARVPRALAGAGMLACVLQFSGITLPAFAGVPSPYAAFFGIPLGVVTLAIAIWLIARGFKDSDQTPVSGRVSSESAGT